MAKTNRKKAKSLVFSKNLNALLKERNLSQKNAAEIMGVSVSVVHDWLQGTYPNDPAAILNLCKTINCDFQWLLTGEEKQTINGSPPLSQIFTVEDAPSFSGIFMIEAKKLERK